MARCGICGSEKDVRYFTGLVVSGYWECRACFERGMKIGVLLGMVGEDLIETEWRRGRENERA